MRATNRFLPVTESKRNNGLSLKQLLTRTLKHMAGIALIGPNQADSTEQSNLALVLSRALPRKQILCRYQTNHLTEVLSWAFVSEGRRRQNLLSAFPATAAVTLSTTLFLALDERGQCKWTWPKAWQT